VAASAEIHSHIFLLRAQSTSRRVSQRAGARMSLMVKQVASAFPTLIGRFSVPEAKDVNSELRSMVLAKARSAPNVQHANVGGWHSGHDLLDWPGEPIVKLRGWIIEAVNHMIGVTMEQMKAGGLHRPFNGTLGLYAWANVSRKGNYHSLHNHPGSCWSGVYYVDTGGTASPEYPNSGVIDLHDPRPFTEMTYVPGEPYGQKFPIRPEAGTILIFPGFLYHFVHPHFGEGERISIAFNARADRRD
jgi:uncharacterized protein (TIGR02466 family)